MIYEHSDGPNTEPSLHGLALRFDAQLEKMPYHLTDPQKQLIDGFEIDSINWNLLSFYSPLTTCITPLHVISNVIELSDK